MKRDDSDKMNELQVDARRERERLCPVCGADKQVWEEVFAEIHYCQGDDHEY